MQPFRLAAALAMLLSWAASADEIRTVAKDGVKPAHSIEAASVGVDFARGIVTFRMKLRGVADEARPAATGKFAGARVHALVWPTSLDPSIIGFEPKSGLLAFAVTVHPDFNDDPFFENDGAKWHSHWVVLGKDAACPGGLKVIDIPGDTKPRLPRTWPGVPLLIDSPGWRPRMEGGSVEVKVPFGSGADLAGARFDVVTAGLRVDASLHTPLLCVADVFHVASGDLGLPGKFD